MTSPEPRKFQIPFEYHHLIGDVISNQSPPSLLMLHGAGTSNSNRFEYLRTRLWAQGIGSCAFDFSGCGDSGGDMGASTLESRTLQACRVVADQNLTLPLSVLGGSMGAYTAVKLLDHLPIANLILVVPAMYAAAAYRVPFTGEFTRIIRSPQSWVTSDAWQRLADFRGGLLIVAGEKDDVIPDDVIQRLDRSARNADPKIVQIIEGAPHQILSYLKDNDPRRLDLLMNQMVSLLGGSKVDEAQSCLKDERRTSNIERPTSNEK
jgi:pimeloyl-ACP methyl ester carboxylesterase